MFTLRMLPASEGDCLVLEYGSQSHPHRILIDGGHTDTAGAIASFVAKLPQDRRDFELIVVTHIDNDHIEGVLSYLPHVDKKATEVWFNGPDQIHETPPVADGRAGAIPEGDSLTHALSDRPWNVAFGHHAVATWQAPVKLPGGLKVTVLSPDKPALKTLAAEWPQITRDAGLVPGNPPLPLPALAKQFHPPANVDEIHAMAAGKFDGKNTETNQSSIALLVEYKGKRVLLGGDSWSDTMQRALKDLVPKGSAGLPVDLVKVPHHGSIHNTSLDLLKMLDCNRFAISTSGRTHHHPDPECIARIITSKTGAQLYFNYRSDESGIWDRQDWKDELEYSTEYASPDTQGWLAIDI